MPRAADHVPGTETYWSHVADAASAHAYDVDAPLISFEALPENRSVLDFKTFAQNYTERLLPCLAPLRIDFQELFLECYLLHKSQSFLAKIYGQVQTRVWQNLRIIEQAVGAVIVLGPNPSRGHLRMILERAGQENTEYGSLANLIWLYAQSRDYAQVAKSVNAPVPAIRKIFRPAIDALLASRDVKPVAVGAYLRSLIHHASLTGGGLGKRHLARARRIKIQRFHAPPFENSALVSFGAVRQLKGAPWNMFELRDHDGLPINTKYGVDQLYTLLGKQKTLPKKEQIFKKATQIFIPTNPDGTLQFGYIFARSVSLAAVRSLTKIHGISEMSATYDDAGSFMNAVTLPDAEVQAMVAKRATTKSTPVRIGDYVEILTGPAARYCGTVTKKGTHITVTVNFASGRQFLVAADPTAVRVIPGASKEQQTFWGVICPRD